MRALYERGMGEAKGLGVVLYEAFWSLRLYDLYVPKARYEAEVSRLRKDVARIEKGWKAGKARAASQIADVERMKRAASDLEAERERQEKVRRKARIDVCGTGHRYILRSLTFPPFSSQHCTAVRRKVEGSRDALLSGLDAAAVVNSTASDLLEKCVYARCMISPEDASYCAKFLRTLVSVDTPSLPALSIYDSLVRSSAGLLYSVTEGEAGNLGVMLREVWTLLSRWRWHEKAFEDEAQGKKAFMIGECFGARSEAAKRCEYYAVSARCLLG